MIPVVACLDVDISRKSEAKQMNEHLHVTAELSSNDTVSFSPSSW